MSDAPDAVFLDLQAALAGRYSLVREIGRGGMGIVYLALEVKLDRLVALKLLPPALAAQPALRERFLREARTAAKLSHPNIIPVFAADEAGPFVYFAMAWVPGETLTERVHRRGPLAPAEVMRILRDAAWALGYAHGHGVVHRDIKPDNILLEEGTNRVLVADFGIASTAEAVTDPGHVVGTPAYMSPEQAAGEPADGRSDLFALGLVAHFALTGRLPEPDLAPGAPQQALLVRRVRHAVPSLAEAQAHLPERLRVIVDRCTAHDPGDRFATAEGLAEALEDARERRPALPAALERWYVSGERLRLTEVLLTPMATAPLFFLIELMNDGVFSRGDFDLTVALVVALAAPAALYVVSRLAELRRVMATGFTREDLVRAVRLAARADRDADTDPESPLAARVDLTVRGGAAAMLVTGGVWLAVMIAKDATTVMEPVAATYAVLGSLLAGWRVLASGRGALARAAQEWRARFWESRPGRLLARAARLALPARAEGDAALHHPTEIGLGLAVSALFDALPTWERRQLPDVKDVVRQLEATALDARARGDEGRLTTAVMALENLRLDLLRLAAGTAGPEGLTADLDAARRIGQDVAAVDVT